jgi:hypothetical protein
MTQFDDYVICCLDSVVLMALVEGQKLRQCSTMMDIFNTESLA